MSQQMELPRTMHKEGSSQQLFVRFDEEVPLHWVSDETVRTTTKDALVETPGSEVAPVSPHGMRGYKALALVAGVLLVVAALVVTSSLVRPVTNRSEAVASAQQKNIEVPDDLLPPPLPEVSRMGHRGHCSFATSETCPASELFYNSEVHEVATENIMQVGRGLFVHADRDFVREAVVAGFKNISEQLQVHSPKTEHSLAKVSLDDAQKKAILTFLRLMSMPLVQSLGWEVALAIRHSVSREPEVVRRYIEEMLQTNLDQIRAVKEEMIPPKVLEFWGTGHLWDMTLDAENIQIMEAFHGGEFYGSMNASYYATNHSGRPKKLPIEVKAYGTWGGVLEQARALLDVVKLIASSAGKDIAVPRQATLLERNVDVEDLGSELLSCELHAKDGMNNFMKALFCPLKYGTQGIDALRYVDSVDRKLLSGADTKVEFMQPPEFRKK